ncbi:YceI family protein [Mariprofundus erugo]|uniref:YceI family protein n=1 Tax=Mariprofundus erugo TaxID=2528639 RepID=A0A5R9GPV9_9PROT|nr:YceI family protein [Mariprofundus erugo]TLS68301.1 YceI family protein [Mariprofundus erugo]TLS77156.1 YceI family protein [Mariprofundus erugo]
MKLKHLLATALITVAAALPAQAAEHYNFDIKGQHAFIEFKIKHLGYSWLLGSFRTFDGKFTYDEQHPENNRVDVSIETASLDTNHAERNKHLRSADFFDVEHFPVATFESSSYEPTGKESGIIHGTLNLHGISKKIDINVEQIGTGNDPWGGYRRGFEGHTTLHLSDYNMKKAAMLGPVAENVELFLSIEGVRQ